MRPTHWIAAALALAVTGLPATARAQNPFLAQGERTIGTIRFEGLEQTREYILRRELGFAPGDAYEPDMVSDAWERLEALPFIAYVDVQAGRPEPGRVDLVIVVEEDRRFGLLPWYDYDERYGDGHVVGLATHWWNFRGRAEELWARSAWWGRHGYAAGWRNPWVLGPARLAVELDAGWEDYRFGYEPVDLTDWGFGAGLGRGLGEDTRARLAARWREIQVDDAPTGFPAGTTHDHHLQLGVQHEGTDLRFYPRVGLRAHAAVRWSRLGDDFPYTLYRAGLSGFAPVPRLGVVAAHASTRAGSRALPLYERSYLGGPSDLRGVELGSVEGDAHLRASVELRRPFFVVALREGRAVGIGAHLFHDWGKAWEHDAGQDSAPLHRSWGAGLHFNFNRYNFRLEWARTDDGEDHLVLGDSFTF